MFYDCYCSNVKPLVLLFRGHNLLFTLSKTVDYGYLLSLSSNHTDTILHKDYQP